MTAKSILAVDIGSVSGALAGTTSAAPERAPAAPGPARQSVSIEHSTQAIATATGATASHTGVGLPRKQLENRVGAP